MSAAYDDIDLTAPPTILPLIVENLPLDDLAPFPHCVTWNLEWRKGKNGKPGNWTKVLKNPRTGFNARSNDSTTWSTAGEVLARFDRFGYVVAEDDPFTFLDVDNGIDPKTNELKPWAQDIVNAMPSAYWERSTTGTGLKGLVRGRVQRNRIVKVGDGQVELFSSGKFTALTGNRLEGSSGAIGESQSDLDALYAKLCPEPAPRADSPLPELSVDDAIIVERVRRMEKGRRLYDDGDLSLYDNDHSRADLGLLNYLVIAGTTDPNQLDRIFRSSPLGQRDKWDRDDYRKKTLGDALDGTVVPFEGWDHPSGQPKRLTRLAKNGVVVGKPQDAGTENDDFAELQAENAMLRQQLAATRRRADTAEAELATLRMLQSATMTMLRSREMRPGEKVLGLVSLFEAEAAQQRGATDPEGWSNVPLGRLADAGGCSPDTAGKHLTTIASTGIVETRTITERDPATGEVRKRRS